MKFIDGLKMRKLGREYIVVAENAKLVNFNKMIALNATAAFMWQSVDGKDFSEEDLVKALLDEYDVDEETARADVAKAVESWREAGIIE